MGKNARGSRNTEEKERAQKITRNAVHAVNELTKEEQAILYAKHAVEPSNSEIRWRKRSWILPKNKTTAKIRSSRPDPRVYCDMLRRAGKNVSICERCNSDYRITIHHKDGNPHNNDIENLQVLCWHCHLLYHDPTEDGVYDELEGTKNDFDSLDDPEVRKFYGITEEDFPDSGEEES
ncbi:HNH endonuclease [Candidatus Bathyarchaeota archaeon]|nr:HNH endonuclease [Candidatus Bathyarchaeota archaeon]